MKSFEYYLLRFMENNPDRLGEIADFVINNPPDSYFGSIATYAKENGINLHEADLDTWKALIDPIDRTVG